MLFLWLGVGYKGFTLYNYEPNPIRIGCGSDMGVETGLLQRMGLRIDPTLRQTVQSQVINLLLVKETGTIYLVRNKLLWFKSVKNANTLFCIEKYMLRGEKKRTYDIVHLWNNMLYYILGYKNVKKSLL